MIKEIDDIRFTPADEPHRTVWVFNTVCSTGVGIVCNIDEECSSGLLNPTDVRQLRDWLNRWLGQRADSSQEGDQ